MLKIMFCEKKTSKLFVGFKKSSTFASQLRKRGSQPQFAEIKLGYGVIGNTTDSGPVIPGSSPGIPTKKDFEISESFLFLCIMFA